MRRRDSRRFSTDGSQKRTETRRFETTHPLAATGPDVVVPSRLPIEIPARYQFRGLLGKGGMGRVYEVADTALGRSVALKALVKDGEESRRRFLLEARTMARLEHPNIVPCYDFDVDPKGRPYCTMRKIEGETLRLALESKTPGEMLPLLAAAARGIAHAHQLGIVHRDVKPHNVMLGQHGEVWVVDWGLVGARAGDSLDGSTLDESQDREKTQDGAVVGTLGYLAPEQLRKGNLEIGPPADVHGLGAILYQILARRPPYPGESTTEIVARMEAGPPDPLGPPAPPPLAAIARKALAVRAEDRYPTAAEFADDLEAYLGGRPVSVYRAPALLRAARWVREHTILFSVAAVLLLAAAGLAAVLAGRTRMAADALAVQEVAAVKEREIRVGRATLGFEAALAEADRAHAERLARLALYSEPFEAVQVEPETDEERLESERRVHELNSLVFQPALEAGIARANDQWRSAAAVARGHVESLREAGAGDDVLEGFRRLLAEELDWAIEVALATERATIASHWIADLRRTADPDPDPDRVPPFYGEAVRLAASIAEPDRLGADHPSVVRARRVLAGRGTLLVGPVPAGARAALVEALTTENPFGRRVVAEAVPAGGGAFELPLGSYAVEVRRGQEVFPFPVLVEREREARLALEIPARVPEGMAFIPPGEFIAGGEAPSSWPRHRRKVARGFFLAVREVTIAEYAPFKPGELEDFDGDYPAFLVSYPQAAGYAAWRTARDAELEYHVPTEGEWYRAARGADGRAFVWGDRFLEGAPWIAQETFQVAGGQPRDRSMFGILDLTGNVFEWCGPPTDGGELAVLRGGAFSTGEGFAAAPSRNPSYADSRWIDRGFRLAARPKK